MASGEYESALPVALDAVQQGQELFKPSTALQLFPLYLLAAQVGQQHQSTYSTAWGVATICVWRSNSIEHMTYLTKHLLALRRYTYWPSMQGARACCCVLAEQSDHRSDASGQPWATAC